MNGQIRSPRYPSASIDQALEDIAKIHASERTNPMDREVAAKALGYSGISGRSATVLANLIQYGLLERVGKNEVRVSRRAVDIIHPDSEASRSAALRAAANEPELFQRVAARFVDGRPSENALHSFLVREGFTDTAIPAAARAYLETSEFLENAIGRGSSSVAPPKVVESQSTQQVERTNQMGQTAATGVNPGRHAEFQHSSSGDNARGAEVFFRQKRIQLGGVISSREQADELIEAIKALKPMLKEDDRADQRQADTETDAD